MPMLESILKSEANVKWAGVFARSLGRTTPGPLADARGSVASSGYRTATTQMKAFWWGKRYQISPYAFGPGGNERSGDHESGGGALAEVDVLPHFPKPSHA